MMRFPPGMDQALSVSRLFPPKQGLNGNPGLSERKQS
jgi:hypothetical protein